VNTVDNTTKMQILILIVGVLIGAGLYLTNSLYLWNASEDKDKTEIAGGLSLDIESLEAYLLTTDQGFLENTGERYVFVQATPLYPDNGLYFSYLRDIPKMDRKVAKDTFSFYNHLLSAERDRALIFEIQRQGDLRELTSTEQRRQQILTRHAAQELNTSVSLLPVLKQELETATGNTW
jgi:hypothetical protein